MILSSSLAAITLLDDHRPTLLARVSGPALTTAIVREGVLCGYRCTELPAQNIELTPQMLLEEIYPWRRIIRTRGARASSRCASRGLVRGSMSFSGRSKKSSGAKFALCCHTAMAEGRVPESVHELADRESDGLVGWMLHRN